MKIIVSRNLLRCIDIRLFGATFAGKTNISIHGPVQVNHGINIWTENNIFSEQITSPFSNKSNDPEAEKGMTTIGRQSKLEEGHYLHHFSVNPNNLEDILSQVKGDENSLFDEEVKELTEEDINKLKEAMRKGATYYDSASKAGTENELLIWVQLKENSKLVLPNFSQLIRMKDEKMDGKVVLDLSELSAKLKRYKDEIEKIEIYRNDASILIENKPDNANYFNFL
jgi:CRISPR-associated protein Csh2